MEEEGGCALLRMMRMNDDAVGGGGGEEVEEEGGRGAGLCRWGIHCFPGHFQSNFTKDFQFSFPVLPF